MKLLVLEPNPSFGGGSEAVMLSLSRELAKRGHSLFLVHESDGSMLDEYREFAAGVTCQRLPGFALRAPLPTLTGVARLGNLARRLGVDAVVSSHLGYIRHGALLHIGYGIPFCFHLGLPCIGSGTTLRMAYRNVGMGIAPSVHTRDTWLAGGWPETSLHVVRNWVDPSRFNPATDVTALRGELDIPVEAPCVVFVGRVCAQKGINVLLRAFTRLNATTSDAHLIIVGAVATEYQQHLETLLASMDDQVRRRVLLRPVTTTPEKYYAAADVVCAPSLGNEAFGLTVLEAMACGVPVIASDVGIIAQILGEEHRGLLVPAGDEDALAQRLQFWLDRPDELVASGMRLRARVLQHYGCEASIDAYENIIAGLTSGTPGKRA